MAIAERYVDLGGNFLHLSTHLPDEPQRLLASGVRALKRMRSDIVISANARLGLAAQHQKTPAMIALCEESLRVIGVDCLDLLWIDEVDGLTYSPEWILAIDDLVKKGTLRAIGIRCRSDVDVAGLHTLIEWWSGVPVAAIEFDAHGLSQGIAQKAMHLLTRARCGWVARSAFLDALDVISYSNNIDRASANSEALQRHFAFNDREIHLAYDLLDIAQCRRTTPMAIGLAWQRAQPHHTSSMVVAHSLAQIESHLRSLQVTLDAADMDLLAWCSSDPASASHAFFRNTVASRGVSQ
jgi:aryl-alcohol dehydrogenase-like predicted oxidoreductase